MIFRIQRLFDNGKYTLDHLMNDAKTFHSFVLEDVARAVKIPGETRIPAGFYPLGIRKQDTELTLKHRANPAYAEWGFKYHIEVLNIQNFNGVYFHSGVDASQTEGCITPGYAFDLTLDKNPQAKSMLAVKAFYAIVYPKLETGEKVFLEIVDEQKFTNQ